MILISILFRGFWHGAFSHFKMIEMDIYSMMNADFAAAVGMITYGALLGKVTMTQLIFILTVEIFLWALNE